MPAASRWRRSFSISTNTATRTRSATAACRKDSKTRRGSRRPIAQKSQSTLPRIRSMSETLLTEGPAPAVDNERRVVPPVTDWIHDFDHTDPRWTENPFPIWDELRAHAPVVHTDRFLGCYLPTTYEAVKQIAYD